MRNLQLFRPDYAQKFQCIGSSCEDDCCTGWLVNIDRPTYEKYVRIEDPQLQPLFQNHLQRSPQEQLQREPGKFATIQMLPSGACPFLSSEKLCCIQQSHGAEALSTTCATFPRTPRIIDGLQETALSLSCPEAARIVLLDPDLATTPAGGPAPHWDETAPPQPSLRNYFWQIREFTVHLLRNRQYPLWQRMFLLGVFARRLDAFSHGKPDRPFPNLLLDFESAVASGQLNATMQKIQPNLDLQLEILIAMLRAGLRTSLLSRRLGETLQAFGQGIGHRPGETQESMTNRYAGAWRKFAEPFFRRHPHFLENYLLNQVYRNLFPFGDRLAQPEAVPEPAHAFTRLAIHYSLIKGVLIGVAGFHQHKLTPENAVHTVQSVYRHFEHNQKFIRDTQALLAQRGLNTPYGLTMLLRN